MKSVSASAATRSDESERLECPPTDQRRAPSMSAGLDLTDALLVGALMVTTFLVHPVALMMRRPYWVDEAWVADLTRLPFARSLSLSSSTPVGWLALLHLIPGEALQRGRVLTLAFAILSSAAAYVLARGLMWRTRGAARVAGVVVAVAVSFVPIAIERNDLKQYTADAFFALALLTVTRAVDSSPRSRSVVWLGVVAVVAVLFSSTSAFVSVACFTGLLATSLARGTRREPEPLCWWVASQPSDWPACSG